MSKAKRKYVRSGKYAKKEPLNAVAGNPTWGDAYEVCADQLMVAEKDNTILRAKLSCLKDLLIEVLRGR